MKNTTTLLYIIIGLLLAILLTTLYCMVTMNRMDTGMGEGSHKSGSMMKGGMMHQMGSCFSGDCQMGGGAGMGMDQMMDGMMAELEGKTGDAFDKAFLSEMIVHHEGAVVMAKSVLKNSKRPELIKLASDIITAQTGEMGMMTNWQKAWFNVVK